MKENNIRLKRVKLKKRCKNCGKGCNSKVFTWHSSSPSRFVISPDWCATMTNKL